MDLEKELQKIENRNFIDLAHQVTKRLQTLLSSKKTAFARIEIETSADWKTMLSAGDCQECSEAIFWLEELLQEL